LCYMPESIVKEHAIFGRKPISLVNTFTQEYELTSEEVHVSHEEYEIQTESVKVETQVVLDPPEMKKSSTIEHDDLVYDDDTDTLSVVSDSVDLSDAEAFPGLQHEDESDSGYEIEQQSPFLTQHLPTYETKVAMTVRSDCTRDSPVIFTLQRKQRVYLLESGIEKFPTRRLSYWWRKTFAGKNLEYAADYIRLCNVTGEELAAFEADTRLRLKLESGDYDTVRKALKLVKRKSQVVFFDENGVPQRGWISKVKKGKQTISRIFQKCTPSLVVRKMHNSHKEIADCEEQMERILQENALDYDAIKFGTWFDEFRHGNEYILRKGRRRHGKWRPENHCLIEFESYMDAAVALGKLSGCQDLRNCEVDFAREYANLTEVTFPRF